MNTTVECTDASGFLPEKYNFPYTKNQTCSLLLSCLHRVIYYLVWFVCYALGWYFQWFSLNNLKPFFSSLHWMTILLSTYNLAWLCFVWFFLPDQPVSIHKNDNESSTKSNQLEVFVFGCFVSFEWNSCTPLEMVRKYIILSARKVIFCCIQASCTKGNSALLSVLALCLQIEIILPSIKLATHQWHTTDFKFFPHLKGRGEKVSLPRRYIYW